MGKKLLELGPGHSLPLTSHVFQCIPYGCLKNSSILKMQRAFFGFLKRIYRQSRFDREAYRVARHLQFIFTSTRIDIYVSVYVLLQYCHLII